LRGDVPPRPSTSPSSLPAGEAERPSASRRKRDAAAGVPVKSHSVGRAGTPAAASPARSSRLRASEQPSPAPEAVRPVDNRCGNPDKRDRGGTAANDPRGAMLTWM
jgi:hypothetical protein